VNIIFHGRSASVETFVIILPITVIFYFRYEAIVLEMSRRHSRDLLVGMVKVTITKRLVWYEFPLAHSVSSLVPFKPARKDSEH